MNRRRADNGRPQDGVALEVEQQVALDGTDATALLARGGDRVRFSAVAARDGSIAKARDFRDAALAP